MKIHNFGVSSPLDKYLEGKSFSFPLIEDNLSKIKNKNIEIITIRNNCKITKVVLDSFPDLKLIVARSVGTDNINLKECKKRNIAVYNIPDYGSFSVAEHAFALLLSKTRKIIELNSKVKKGKFLESETYSLKGKILGIIGTGKIGLAVAKLAKAFQMKIICFDIIKNEKEAKKIGFKYVTFDELIKKSDIISLHIPLTEKTKYIINENIIKKMKRNVILINTARGGLIDTKALIDNLNKFKYICLDVLEDENNLSKYNELLRSNKVIITPHTAFFSDETISKIAKKTKENIENFLKGIKKNRII